MFRIVRIKADGDYVRMYVQDEETETCFIILAEDFYRNRYSSDDELDSEQYSKLKQLHAYCFGYRKCLRKLAVKDQSVAEIKQMLDEVDNITQQQKETILKELCEMGFVDDEKLVQSQLEYDQQRLLGHRSTFYRLVKRGVERDLINEVFQQLDPRQEIANGVTLANNLYGSLTGMSHYQAINKIREKLMANGYDSSQINLILAECSFEKDEQKQLAAAVNAARTGYNRYRNRYEGKTLTQKLYQFLMNKGYNRDEIYEAIQTLEVNEDEDR